MSISTVEIRAFSGPDLVELGSAGRPTIIRLNVGPKGDPGAAATIAVGTTTTGAAGTNASVTNSGTTSAAVFNFTIPRGDTGATGAAGPNSVTSATTSDYTAELDLAQVNTGVLVVTDGVTIETLDYNFGTGSAQALKDALEIASADITDASAEPLANALVLYNGNGEIQAKGFFSIDDGGGLALVNGDETQSVEIQHGLNFAHILYDGSVLDLNIQGLGNYTQVYPTGSGKFALTQTANGEPDKLTNGTIEGATTFNSTSYTYGTGAAAAHRTALGVGTRISALASNTSVTNTTTLQTVASLSVVAGKSYAVYAQIAIDGTVNTGTRHGLTFPASTFIRMTRKRSSSYIPVEVSANLNLGLAETSTLAELVGFITVTVTGTVELQFAQNTANANTTTCRTFTFLTLTELV
jgi:hypothetical protein